MADVKGKRIVEWLKTTLIVLLAVSALLLGMRTRIFNDIFNAIPLFGNVADMVRGSTPGTTEPSSAGVKEAALPIAIVITSESGERYGVKYDTALRNAAYDRTSIILGEALGSATAQHEITEDEWREALMGAGLYFEYLMPVKLSILERWLGSPLQDVSWDVSIRRVFVAFGEEKSSVYYQDLEDGTFYAADTASSAGKAQELGIYVPNGAQFAFEAGVGVAENAPYMLLMPGSDHQELRASVPYSMEELLDITLDAMGHGNETTSHRYDSEGMLVRIGTQFNIRAAVQGNVVYLRTDSLPQGEAEQAYGDSEIIEMARVIVGKTIGSSGSGAEPFFEALEYGENGTRTVLFGYYIAGARIAMSEERNAAAVTFVGGTIIELELMYKSFALSGEYVRLMPERQALASAGGEFLLSYRDTGAERLQPFWLPYG